MLYLETFDVDIAVLFTFDIDNAVPANTKHLYDICTMLVQRRHKCDTNVLCLLGYLLTFDINNAVLFFEIQPGMYEYSV